MMGERNGERGEKKYSVYQSPDFYKAILVFPREQN